MDSIDIETAHDWVEMYYRGPAYINIADAIGISRTTLWRMRERYGITELTGKYAKRFLKAYPEYEA